MTDTVTLPRSVVQAALDAMESAADNECNFNEYRLAAVALRAALAATQQAEPVALTIPPGMMLVPDWKGYALLGTGMYAINHSAPPADPVLGAELFITFATEAEKSGNRRVGERRDNPPDAPPTQPEEMVIRIGFLSERAVFALEDQLSALREAHGWAAPQKQSEPLPMASNSRDLPVNPDDNQDYGHLAGNKPAPHGVSNDGQPAQADQGVSRTFAAGDRRNERDQDDGRADRRVGGEAPRAGGAGSEVDQHRRDGHAEGADGSDARRGATDVLLTEAEPVAWVPVIEGRPWWNGIVRAHGWRDPKCEYRPLYAHPPQGEQDRIDAARYRYLRDRAPRQVVTLRGLRAGAWIDCEDADGKLTLLTGEDADAAVDAAMQGQTPRLRDA